MTYVLYSLLALAAMAVSAYAQRRLPFHTTTRTQAAVARLILGVIGVAVGWTALIWYQAGAAPAFLQAAAFLIGFGMVHVPAAFILWSKRLRGVHR